MCSCKPPKCQVCLATKSSLLYDKYKAFLYEKCLLRKFFLKLPVVQVNRNCRTGAFTWLSVEHLRSIPITCFIFLTFSDIAASCKQNVRITWPKLLHLHNNLAKPSHHTLRHLLVESSHEFGILLLLVLLCSVHPLNHSAFCAV